MTAVDPEPDLGRIERVLAVAFESGATADRGVDQMDLVADPDALVAQVARSARALTFMASAPLGVPDSTCSAHVSQRPYPRLLGASGSGKSTLVNALAGTTVMGTQAIRRVRRAGTAYHHLSSARPAAGPGRGSRHSRDQGCRPVRQRADGLAQAFADIEELGRGLPVQGLPA